MSESTNPIQNLYTEFSKIIDSIVVKYSHKAEEAETVKSKSDADQYMDAYMGKDNFYSYIYTKEDLSKLTNEHGEKIFPSGFAYEKFTNETVDKIADSYLENGYEKMPQDIKDKLVLLKRQEILDSYEEKNTYYRMLLGKPAYDTPESEFLYVPEFYLNKYNLYYTDDNSYIGDNGTYISTLKKPIPIHEVQDERGLDVIETLRGLGLIDELIAANPNAEYLNYLGANRIEVAVSRKAAHFEILRMQEVGIRVSLLDEFKRIYSQARRYFISTIYISYYNQVIDFYENFIGMCIMVMTIQQVVMHQLPRSIDREFFDINGVKLLYEAYNVPYNLAIDDYTQKGIVQYLNMLIQNKATNKVIFDLAALLGYRNIHLYKYYLAKVRKFDKHGVPIVSKSDEEVVNPQTGELEQSYNYDKMYDIYFHKVDLNDEDFTTTLTDPTKRLEYEEITGNDPYWFEDSGLLKTLWESEYNFVESKYLGLGLSYSMSEIMFENVILLRLLMDTKNDLSTIKFTVPKIAPGIEITIFEAIILLCCLISKKNKLGGEIITVPTQVISVLDYMKNQDVGTNGTVDTLQFNFKYFKDYLEDRVFLNKERIKEILEPVKSSLHDSYTDSSADVNGVEITPEFIANLVYTYIDYYGINNPELYSLMVNMIQLKYSVPQEQMTQIFNLLSRDILDEIGDRERLTLLEEDLTDVLLEVWPGQGSRIKEFINGFIFTLVTSYIGNVQEGNERRLNYGSIEVLEGWPTPRESMMAALDEYLNKFRFAYFDSHNTYYVEKDNSTYERYALSSPATQGETYINIDTENMYLERVIYGSSDGGYYVRADNGRYQYFDSNGNLASPKFIDISTVTAGDGKTRIYIKSSSDTIYVGINGDRFVKRDDGLFDHYYEDDSIDDNGPYDIMFITSSYIPDTFYDNEQRFYVKRKDGLYDRYNLDGRKDPNGPYDNIFVDALDIDEVMKLQEEDGTISTFIKRNDVYYDRYFEDDTKEEGVDYVLIDLRNLTPCKIFYDNNDTMYIGTVDQTYLHYYPDTGITDPQKYIDINELSYSSLFSIDIVNRIRSLVSPEFMRKYDLINKLKRALDDDDAEELMTYVNALTIPDSSNKTKIEALNKMYSSIKGLSRFINKMLSKTDDKNTYTMLKQLYDTAFYTKESKEIFTINSGDDLAERTAFNFFEYLYHESPTLYSALFTTNIRRQHLEYQAKLTEQYNIMMEEYYEFHKNYESDITPSYWIDQYFRVSYDMYKNDLSNSTEFAALRVRRPNIKRVTDYTYDMYVEDVINGKTQLYESTNYTIHLPKKVSEPTGDVYPQWVVTPSKIVDWLITYKRWQTYKYYNSVFNTDEWLSPSTDDDKPVQTPSDYIIDCYECDVERGYIRMKYDTFLDEGSEYESLETRIYYYSNHLIGRLEEYIDDLKFVYLTNDSSTPLAELLLRLINFFKSYTVDMLNMEVLFVFDMKEENIMKFFDMVDNIQKTVETRDNIHVTYSDVIAAMKFDQVLLDQDGEFENLSLKDKAILHAYYNEKDPMLLHDSMKEDKTIVFEKPSDIAVKKALIDETDGSYYIEKSDGSYEHYFVDHTRDVHGPYKNLDIAGLTEGKVEAPDYPEKKGTHLNLTEKLFISRDEPEKQ